MYFPAIDDERTTFANYLQQELEAIRDASYGLTEDQARQTPLRSRMSLAGLLKHAAWAMAGALGGAGREVRTTIDLEDFPGSFALTGDETFDELKRQFDDLKADYVQMCRELDPDMEMEMPPAPWFGIGASTVKLRYLLGHHLQEFARHAGHADIVREQIDGAQAADLWAAVAGMPANDYVRPWSPDDDSE